MARIAALFAAMALVGCSLEKPAAMAETPPTFVPVKPVAREKSGGTKAAPAAKELRIGQGRFFSYAMPPDWTVGEDGQFALTLVAPDSKALTVMVGNAGVPPTYPPGQFAWEKLMAIVPENLKFGELRKATPVAGFGYGFDFDISYAVQGVACRGLVKVSVAPAYDTAAMAMTAALSAADQWPGYSTWLPQVAAQISATDGAAFGMRGLMQQNLRNSTAYADAAREYRSWSQKNWQQVTDDRNAQEDRKNVAVREGLGGVQTYSNPYGSQPVELPTTFKSYWTDREGNVVGTDDPTANPNVGSTVEWARMERVGGK